MIKKTGNRQDKRNFWIGLIVIVFSVGILYLQTQVRTIYGGDAGDLVSAIITSGIAHPPGYPLYTALGIDLIKLIPVDTYAYRVGFLSSIPSLAAIILLYILLCKMSGKFFLSFLAVVTLALTYPIWLFASVVEVFALNNLFIVVLISTAVYFHSTHEKKFLYLTCFIFGLSLTHHHIILFLLPTLLYLIYKSKRQITLPVYLKCFMLFLSGLIPYWYTIIASLYNPAMNWQGEGTLINFIQLVTRASYGTFQAGGYIAHEPILRLIDMWTFFDFLYKDFRLAGILLMAVGFLYSFRQKKEIPIAVMAGIVSYLFFLFYASFPLVHNFLVGTFERFVQPLYILLTFFLLYGMMAVTQFFLWVKNKIIRNLMLQKITLNMSYLIIILPLGLFLLNYKKISILKNDFTAENLGRDILNTVEPNSIILISTDTPLFNTQYVYYSERKWPDVALIHFQKLFHPEYFSQLSKYHPSINNIDQKASSVASFQSFLDNNYSQVPIYSKVSITAEMGSWAPYGLLFRYFKDKDMPRVETIAEKNENLWASYHDPTTGSLALFQHLLLSDVLPIYAIARQETGYYMARNGVTNLASQHLLEAERIFPKDTDTYVILAQVYITQRECQKADDQISKLKKINPDDAQAYYVAALNYAACWKDEQKALYYQKLYEEKKQLQETKLEKL